MGWAIFFEPEYLWTYECLSGTGKVNISRRPNYRLSSEFVLTRYCTSTLSCSGSLPARYIVLDVVQKQLYHIIG